jgi:predicted nucleic acid-binding protein
VILVDTSVWIDFFRGKLTPQVEKLEMEISGRTDICLCPLIQMEILQGIRNDQQFEAIKSKLNDFINLEMNGETYLMSAMIYRKLRKKGLTIRKSIDCLIASVAIQNKVRLLHSDRDFIQLAKHTDLEVI